MQKLDLVFIKNRRIELKISQRDLAIKLGLKTGSSYLKYEQGVYAFKAEQLPTLAKHLKCKITDFFVENVSDLETNSA
ncbi:helix-turn-helix transcriptional regulator [Bacillus subtilis]|uniref:helix-turn-helix domain-containing protein n=1 Tax=Bacillus subtilis TaxID=1423 RepID=UPI002954B364|nr:helix-turn-helix transcriptional regulator [Bacillus subtilis]WOO45584.1 helix-turn-helix transcriptional regulator [Bacillus subtilis]